MDVELQFGGERVVLEIPDDRVSTLWSPPVSRPVGSIREAVLQALEAPIDFPPLRQAVVPGDRVVLAVGAGIPGVTEVLEAVCETLNRAGVEADTITVLTRSVEDAPRIPEGTHRVLHDPAAKAELAYLSSTTDGQRIYLNRLLTDADFVLPIGVISVDPGMGVRGPWSALYPNMSDRPIIGPGATSEDAQAESVEVGWLLGTPFQLGIVDGDGQVLAGRDVSIREKGTQAVQTSWTVEIAERPDLILGAVGPDEVPTTWEMIGHALTNATATVQRGGKIVLLSRLAEPLGPALQRLVGIDEPREAVAALSGAEGEPDYQAARALANAIGWADVYLASALADEMIEDLGLIPLSRPRDAQRLLTNAYSCAAISRIEAVRIQLSAVDSETR